ncbi:MAG: anti sigma-E protein RseA [Polaromonas sp.]|nr:anti sigma-E protein RseA [Polaromonas sp.]
MQLSRTYRAIDTFQDRLGPDQKQTIEHAQTTAFRTDMNNTTHHHRQRELLSALADGEISSDELCGLLSDTEQGAAVRSDWAAYQLIGDVLRSPGRSVLGADTDFVDKFNRRLAFQQLQVTSLPAVQPGVVEPPQPKTVLGTFQNRGPASNDGNFRWKLLAGFASLAAVSAVGFNALGFLAPVNAPQLAQSSGSPPALQPLLVASPEGTMVRDARLEQLLAAHKQMGATSAFQVPSGFLRNATFEAPQQAAR